MVSTPVLWFVFTNNEFFVYTVPTPNVTISPSGPIQGVVGSPQVINCTVSTISGVESSSVVISWVGPSATSAMGPVMNINDSRVIISPTTSSGNTYTSSLQFIYLMEGVDGNYICNVMILEASASDLVELNLSCELLQIILIEETTSSC